MKSKTQSGKHRPIPLRASASVAALAAALLIGTVADGSAQVLRRGVQGGLLGAGVGAIVGGGKGAAKGAAIGAAIGAVVGANERGVRGAPPPPPPGPPPVAYDGGLIYNIQVSLNRLGYNPGPADGKYGQRTAEAIRAYEYNNQLPLSGQPSPGLYNHMRQQGG